MTRWAESTWKSKERWWRPIRELRSQGKPQSQKLETQVNTESHSWDQLPKTEATDPLIHRNVWIIILMNCWRLSVDYLRLGTPGCPVLGGLPQFCEFYLLESHKILTVKMWGKSFLSLAGKRKVTILNNIPRAFFIQRPALHGKLTDQSLIWPESRAAGQL